MRGSSSCPPTNAGPAIVWAAGDIDLTNVGLFQAALDAAAAAAAAFTVDLTAVTYADSATIRALITAARQTRLTDPGRDDRLGDGNPAEGLRRGPGRRCRGA